MARLSEHPLDPDDSLVGEADRAAAAEGQSGTAPAGLFAQAEAIQTAVRRRVETRTWDAFWLVGILFWTVEETAKHLKMNNAAVFKAKARVSKMLRDEGRRRLLLGIDSGSGNEPVG